MNNNMNNHSDENIHHVPVGDMRGNRYQNHRLNAIMWLQPLESQFRHRRITIYQRKQMEIDEIYEQLAAARQQQSKGK